ncbi:MAG: alanine racemase [Acidobacteria bacterium]|nr:MAG: alanine racemase [Acidobacteriota bacterium]
MPLLPFRSYALISREQIVHNYRSVRAAAGPGVAVMAVVKADAYGHGAVEVARVLVGEGVEWLAVSSVTEGVTLRRAGIRTPILVMTGFLPQEWNALSDSDLTPAMQSLDELAALDRTAREAGKTTSYHLKIDSGMNRLGTPAAADEIIRALRSATYARLNGLMTHFASPADYTSSQTDQQTAYFSDMLERLRNAGFAPPHVHISSTNALAYKRNPGWLTMVRPGHALYGYVSPARGDAPKPVLDVKPVLTWKAKILVVKEIPEGARVGYGGAFRAPQPMRIAVLAAGYADGVPHRLSNRGKVIAAGKLAPILGTVCMDLTTIDISHTASLGPGDEVTLLGREGDVSLDAQQLARMAGTISYAILCGIGERVERVYV